MTVPVLRSLAGAEWLDGSPSEDRNPARPDEVVAEVRLADAAAAVRAVEAARAAFPAWRATPPPARGEILRRAADLLDGRADDIGREFAREEGKTLAEAVGETRRAVAILRYYAAQTLEPDGETYPSASPVTLLYARREPVGVVLAVTPWNFPIAIPTWKIAPALAYGNTVVWKPAELTPLTSVRLLEALREAGLPDGVLNLVLGRGSVVGDALTGHPDIDAITFTGSNPVGRAIQRRATERGVKVQLELGGKNPAVVLADADLDLATLHVARGAFLSAGQKCTATSRVIVERPIMDAFAERLAAVAREWKLGDPLDPDTRVGPVVSRAALDSIVGYLERGRADGGRFLAGGGRAERLGDGYFVEPTVVDGLDAASPLVREEIFGPVAALLPADDFGDALAQANDTMYGLSASLFTRDLGAALRFAQDVRAGVVKVNQESAGLEFQVPFGGMKESSSGSREQGKVARDFFTQWKTVYLDRPPGG
ncbi:MAG TPA: aldehyde dehydrogenase family protein [Candidatus Dormibacteraeota bacterium]